VGKMFMFPSKGTVGGPGGSVASRLPTFASLKIIQTTTTHTRINIHIVERKMGY